MHIKPNEKSQSTDNIPIKQFEDNTHSTFIENLIYIDHSCNILVPVKKPLGDIVHLFDIPPEHIEFNKVSESKVGFVLEEVTAKTAMHDENLVTAQCVFAKEPRTRAVFEWDYDGATKNVHFQEAYNGLLPRWTKMGNPQKWLNETKGIPTAKLMNILLYHKLGLDKDKVSSASSCAMNAQTTVDVLHAMIVNGKSVDEALALCQTVQLLAELGQMLGYKNTILNSVKADTPGAYTYIANALFDSGWSEEQISEFKKQPKIKDLENIGVPILDSTFKVPDALNITVVFSD